MDYHSDKDIPSLSEAFPEGRSQRRRSTAVTMLLAALIVCYTSVVSVNIAALTNPTAFEELQRQYPNVPTWFFTSVTIGVALNVIWAIALLRWMKVGFYGLFVTSLVLCLLHVPAYQALPPPSQMDLSSHRVIVFSASTFPVSVFILFVLLKIGGPRSTWQQLD